MKWVEKPIDEQSVVDRFMHYCKYYSYGYKRKRPLRDATLNRYYRGLCLAEKIIGHDITEISEADQLLLMKKIREYKQGTRKVTIEIYQRFIAFCIRRGYYNGPNLIRGHENEIIGEFEPLQVHTRTEAQIRAFMMRVKKPLHRLVLGLMYYGGLTAEEIGSLKTEAVTSRGVYVFRKVRGELQLLPLPRRFVEELHEWIAQRDSEKVFDFSDNDRGRSIVATIFRSAKLEAGIYPDMTMKDFRRSGIKHFYERCYDVELTKRFAGVKNVQKGWLHELQDEASYYMKTIAEGRPYYDSDV